MAMPGVTWRFPAEKALLSYYRENESLWHPRHPEYYNKQHRALLLEELCHKLQKEHHLLLVNSKEVARKFKNLRTTFNRERKKVEGYQRSESRILRRCTSKWPHYNDCLFLKDLTAEDNVAMLVESSGESHILPSVESNDEETEDSLAQVTEAQTSDETPANPTASKTGPSAVTLRIKREATDDDPRLDQVIDSYPPTPQTLDVQGQLLRNVGAPTTSGTDVPLQERSQRKRKRKSEADVRLAMLRQLLACAKREAEEPNDSAWYFCKSIYETLKLLPPAKQEEAKLDMHSVLLNHMQDHFGSSK